MNSFNRRYLPRSLKDFEKFSALDEVRNVQLHGARVLWADYPTLKHDFPFLRVFSNDQIKKWLLRNYSSVSEKQILLQNIRTTEIPLTGEIQTAYRHRYHGRGDMLEVKDPFTGEIPGIIDRKGSGIFYKHLGRNVGLFDSFENDLEKVRRAKKTNGLLYLGQALRELHMDTVERILRLRSDQTSTPMPDTVRNYAIIQLPFNIYYDQEGNSQPAALVLRQASIGRVWLPDYAIPEDVQISGASFMGNVVDAGSFLFRNKELVPYFDEAWVKDATQPKGKTGRPGYAMLPDFTREVLQSKDPEWVIQNHIDEMGRVLPAPRPLKIEEISAEAMMTQVLEKIIEDPKEWALFLAGFHLLHRRDLIFRMVDKELVFQAIRAVLNLPEEIRSITGLAEEVSVRANALPMLTLLPTEEALPIIREELSHRKNLTHLRLLAEYSWLFPYDEIKDVLSELVALAPKHFTRTLRIKCMDPDLAEHGDIENLKKMARFAQSNPETRKYALSEFIHLFEKKSGCSISLAELLGGFTQEKAQASSPLTLTMDVSYDSGGIDLMKNQGKTLEPTV